MSVIKLTDTPMDAVMKMSEGNPGAIHALMDIVANAESIDPQGAMGGLGAILLLDTFEIRGSHIYILYNDKCNRDVRDLLMLIRAVQLGLLNQSRLVELAQDEMRSVNLTDDEMMDLDKQVCDRLEHFKKAA
jgi:hypothetical protein